MDSRDKVIIDYLDYNCRQPTNLIARRILLSKQATTKRIDNLKKSGIIQAYFTITDYFTLGYNIANLYLKLEGLDEKRVSDFILQLKSIHHITWIARLFGEYDLAISIFFKNMPDLSEVLSKVHGLFTNYLEKSKLFFVKSSIISSIQLSQKFDRQNFISNITGSTAITLDGFDKKLLSLIESNSRASYISLAELLGLTSNAIKYRLKKLESKGVILGYKLLLDYNKLGYQWNLCMINTKFGVDLKALIKALTQNPQIVFINIMIDGTLIIDVLSKNFSELKDLLNNLKNEYPDVIGNYQLLNVLGINKLVSYII